MSESKKILVIYHSNCADGFTAAWACWKKFGDSAEYYPGVYQNPPPDCTGKEVLIVDFSYKMDVMRQICKVAESVIMLDHHATAEEIFKTLWEERGFDKHGNFGGRFTLEESGALITWKKIFPELPVPKFVEIISDRDLWQFKFPYTREVMAAIFSFEYSFEQWESLYNLIDRSKVGMRQLQNEGAAIERKHHKDIAELTASFRLILKIGPYFVPAANLPYTLTSDAGHLLCESHPKFFAACFWFTKEGVVFSLRSREEGLDVSEIAKTYGGGGHKHAAGFRVCYMDFMQMLEDGKLGFGNA